LKKHKNKPENFINDKKMTRQVRVDRSKTETKLSTIKMVHSSYKNNSMSEEEFLSHIMEPLEHMRRECSVCKNIYFPKCTDDCHYHDHDEPCACGFHYRAIQI